MMYNLAGLSDPQTGWGLAGDTFSALSMLQNYGVDTWFNLGDRDLATHIRRTQLLGRGETLSEVTRDLCQNLGVMHQVVPMSDDPVRTIVVTDVGELAMQEYFVRLRAEPSVRSVEYAGAESARPSPGFEQALKEAGLIVFCPSNPFLSLGPILAVPGVRQCLENSSATRVAVSPIIDGAAVKGPAAKIMAEMGQDVSCGGVASQYRSFCDLFLLDHLDGRLAPQIERLGVKPVTATILMESDADKVALAQLVVDMGSKGL